MNLGEEMVGLQSAISEYAAGASDLHELISLILDRLPLGIFVRDVENQYNYLYWNRFMEEFTGKSASDVLGRNDLELDCFDTFASAAQRQADDRWVVKTGETLLLHGKVRDVSGEFKDIELTKFPVYLSNSKPLLAVLWRDVTSREETERLLKRTRVLTKMALWTSGVRTCSIFINQDSTVNFDDSVVVFYDWNSLDDQMLEVTWDIFVSKVHPDEREEYTAVFRSLCRNEVDSVKMEARVRNLGSDKYEWQESIAHVHERDEQGRPKIILGCSTNIQSRKAQELSLQDAMSRAETADRMKSKYLADMSHEIRTPLNAISGFAELMAFADSDEERISYYEIIKTNNQLLMQLINDILDLSKIEADVIKISYTELDVNELIGTVYVSARLRMPAGVTLVLEKGAETCLFGTDGIRLMQLITNLVNNAIKNTHSGTITLGYKCMEGGNLCFYVRDTGIGIVKERLNNMFDRFVKLNDYVEGIGLGLAICKSLITKMGGSIHVESEEGKGSEFSFILPPHEVSGED